MGVDVTGARCIFATVMPGAKLPRRGQQRQVIGPNKILRHVDHGGVQRRLAVVVPVITMGHQNARTSAWSGKGCLRPNREDTDGVHRPPLELLGCTPPVCSRVNQKRSGWGVGHVRRLL